MDIYREALQDLREEAKAEARRVRESNKIDDMAEHLRESRALERESLLPADRRCPRCHEQKLDPQQWVTLIDGRSYPHRWRAMYRNWQERVARAIDRGDPPPTDTLEMVCKSCTLVEPSEMLGNPFTPIVYFNLDSLTIKRARFNLRLSGEHVARLCGWTQPKQSKMESRSNVMIERSQAQRLQEVLELDELPVLGDPDIRYLVDPVKLSALRRSVGASRRLVGTWLGVSKERVRTLERVESVIAGRIAKTMVRGFVRMISNQGEDCDTDSLFEVP